MEPFYFGDNKELFGIYHAAEGMPKKHAVVVAAPLLNEYMRAHFALRRISLTLAQSGFDVLRFDYTGMGNSKGSLENTLPDRWVDDISDAVQEISDISGNTTVSIIAVRFAAHLAASVTHQRNIEQLVMWDPILEGRLWLQSLRRARPMGTTNFSEYLLVKEREFMGHLTCPSFVTNIGSRPRIPIRTKKNYAVITETRQIQGPPTDVAQRVDLVSFYCGWEDLSSQVLYPHEVIDSICAAIS